MNKQSKNKIGWCDYTWNPVTGCYNDCFYCYAKGMAERFGKNSIHEGHFFKERPRLYAIDEPLTYDDKNGKTRIDPFPALFSPTFHWYRLDEPFKKKQPAVIFVCSNADLFGEWVLDEWIDKVFEACWKAPQHKYLFLTKNGERMADAIEQFGDEPNWWFGQTITKLTDHFTYLETQNRFVSFEPILTPMYADKETVLDEWLIFGAMTGILAKKYPVKWEDIKSIVEQALERGVPIYMKPSMKGIVPDEYYVQQMPKELVK